MRQLLTPLSLLCTTAALGAQNPCQGNGVGSAYISTTAARIGVGLDIHVGSTTQPNGLGLLVFGNGGGAALPECIDISGLFIGYVALFNASGDCEFNFAIPAGTFGLGPIYAKGLALEGSAFSLSKTVRISVEYPNSSSAVPVLPVGRSLHTCTAFEGSPIDNRTGALVAGGATGSMIQPVALASTYVFDSLTRTWSPGPNLAVPRASHAAVRLANGDILISGGMTNAGGGNTGGPAVATCEIYSPSTNTLTPTGSMLLARMGHAMTLLDDGRVLVSGGFANWTNAGPNFAAMLNTARNTSEIYNPATGVWAAGPTMASKRSGHTQTKMANGTVVIVSGIDGGTQHAIPGGPTIEIPTFNVTCERFNPSTNTLTPLQSIALPRGFHGASRTLNGNVLVTGGAAAIGTYGEAAATNSCIVFDAVTGTWSASASLPSGVAFHTHHVSPTDGSAWLTGGYTGNFASLLGSDAVALHDGVAASPLAPYGSNPSLPPGSLAVGAHAGAVLHDGTLLVTGGFENITTLDKAFLVIAP